MGDFDAAFDVTMGHEGGYANDPSDFGGETYRGIARRFHPSWFGWTIIDQSRKEPGFPGAIPHDRLDRYVREFYRNHFWLPVAGEDVEPHSVAAELFDTAVNMGPSRAVEFLQVALNALNRNGKLYPDLVEDGDMGPRTLAALDKYLQSDPPLFLLKALNGQQCCYYIERTRKVPSQERFLRGWLARVSLGG